MFFLAAAEFFSVPFFSNPLDSNPLETYFIKPESLTMRKGSDEALQAKRSARSRNTILFARFSLMSKMFSKKL